MKELNLTYDYKVVGTVTIPVPDHMTLTEAIEYARENMHDIPLPDSVDYVKGSESIYEDNCEFGEDICDCEEE